MQLLATGKETNRLSQRSAVHDTHFFALPEFGTMQTEHVHPPALSGFFIPAATQSNPGLTSLFAAS